MDLHTHTNNSDGEYTVLENINLARENKYRAIAITDHDNINSWNLIDDYDDIIAIKGVELSTFYKGDSVHILGYYLNNGGSYKQLEDKLKSLQDKREKRVHKMIELLHQFDIYLTYEEIVKYADGVVARPHVARAIMEKYTDREYTSQYIFENFIGDDKPAYVPTENLDTYDAIKLLHDNNCIAVLAHPLYIKKFNYQEIKDLGIDGIECFYAYFDIDEKECKKVLKFAKENNLIVTGGSDFHGPNVRNTFKESYLEGEYEDIFLKVINKI